MADSRLKLTVAYDGTALPRLGAPARRAHGRRDARRCGPRRLLGPRGGSRSAGRTDAGVHALANVVSVEVDRGPAARVGGGGAQRPSAAGPRRARRRPGSRRVSCPVLRALALYRYRIWRGRRALAVRGEPLALVPAAARSGSASRLGGGDRRRARLPGLHADRHPAPGLRAPRRSRREWHDRGEIARARDHGRLVSAPHGPDARRDDARAPTRELQASAGGRPALGGRADRTGCGLYLVGVDYGGASGRRPCHGVHAERSDPAGSPAACVATIGRVRFPVVLFDLDGTVVDSGGIILASMRHATRSVLGREIPDEALMAAVGGPGLEAQMLQFGGEEHLDELIRVYRAHNEPLHSELLLCPGMGEVLARLDGEGRTPRDRLGQAPRRPSSSPSPRPGSAASSTSSSAATRPNGTSPRPIRCCSRSSGSARERRRRRLRRRLALRHDRRQGRRDVRDRRHAGAACTRESCSHTPTWSSTRRRSSLPPSDEPVRRGARASFASC